MTPRRPLAVLVASCALLVVACGDDDGGGGDTAGFCRLLNQEDVGDDPAVIAAEFERLRDAAPSELRDDVQTVINASQALLDLPDDATEDQFNEVLAEFESADAAADRIEEWSEENCPEGS